MDVEKTPIWPVGENINTFISLLVKNLMSLFLRICPRSTDLLNTSIETEFCGPMSWGKFSVLSLFLVHT